MSGASSEYLAERARWLIRIRWVAAPGVAAATFVASRLSGLSVSVTPLYSIAALLAVANLLYSYHLKRAVRGADAAVASAVSRAANAQISVDLIFLGALIHYAGGVENPFLFYFVFHMIIASILLTRRAAFLQATLAVVVFSSVFLLEYTGRIPHHCLTGFVVGTQHVNALHILGVSLALGSTLYAAVYMASSVAASLRERDARLQEMNELLVEKDSIQSEYVYRVTHDIKGHLSAIRGCLDPVLAGITGTLNPAQLNLIGRAAKRTDTLMTFARALLELTRMRLSKKIAMDDVRVIDMIGAAVSYVQARAAERSISIAVETDGTLGVIRGARVYLEETVANLLANAVKYSREGGRVTLSGTGVRDSIRLEIRDGGIGIPADELPSVFEEFYRATNARRKERDGTGLGLSMAKQVLERHGGSISIDSEEGRGTTVILILPRCSEDVDADSAV